MTRAMRRLYLSHAWRRATWGMGQPSIPSRFLLEIPAELMVGPDLSPAGRAAGGGDGLDVDLDLAFGSRRTTRFGTPIRAGGALSRNSADTGTKPINSRPIVTP